MRRVCRIMSVPCISFKWVRGDVLWEVDTVGANISIRGGGRKVLSCEGDSTDGAMISAWVCGSGVLRSWVNGETGMLFSEGVANGGAVRFCPLRVWWWKGKAFCMRQWYWGIMWCHDDHVIVVWQCFLYETETSVSLFYMALILRWCVPWKLEVLEGGKKCAI